MSTFSKSKIRTPSNAIIGQNYWQAANALIGDWYTNEGNEFTTKDLYNDLDYPAGMPRQMILDALKSWVKAGKLKRIRRGVYAWIG